MNYCDGLFPMIFLNLFLILLFLNSIVTSLNTYRTPFKNKCPYSNGKQIYCSYGIQEQTQESYRLPSLTPQTLTSQ